MLPRSCLTVDDLLAVACAGGVRKRLRGYRPKIGLTTGEALLLFRADGEALEAITKAARLDGYGDGSGDGPGYGPGDGYGYGYGPGYGDGEGCGKL